MALTGAADLVMGLRTKISRCLRLMHFGGLGTDLYGCIRKQNAILMIVISIERLGRPQESHHG